VRHMVVTYLICRTTLIDGAPHRWHIQIVYNIKVARKTSEPMWRKGCGHKRGDREQGFGVWKIGARSPDLTRIARPQDAESGSGTVSRLDRGRQECTAAC
jgi:hypothetical protein